MAQVNTAKVDIGQILLIATLVQQFVTKVKASVTGTPAQRKAAIIKAIREALPLIETALGKDLLHDDKFNEAITAIVDAFLKAPTVAKVKPRKVQR